MTNDRSATAESTMMDALLDAAPAGFVSFADDGTIGVVNKTLLELLGYEREHLLGRHVETIFAAGGRVFYHTHLFPLLKLQGRAEEIFLTLRTRSGEEIPALLNAVRRDRAGGPANDCIVLRIRQRRLYEDAILAAKQAAEEASATKEKFLSMMSHDLRTPLQAISGFAEVLLQGFHGPLNEAQQHEAALIKSTSHEVARMINDILEFARMERGRVAVDLQRVPVEAALTRAEAIVRLRIHEAGLQYGRDGSAMDAAVRADPDRLQQVLLNLLTNAIKFTEPGGSVRTIADREEGWVALRIADTGPGIPPDKLRRIFEPFVQVQPDQRGFGLGLAITRELTDAMGGQLSVESTEGEGSIFTVRLPEA